jgi:hypothetical protein
VKLGHDKWVLDKDNASLAVQNGTDSCGSTRCGKSQKHLDRGEIAETILGHEMALESGK